MFHFNTDTESFGKYLNQLAEVHTFVSNVVEDGLIAVALIFHITDFHIQVQVQCDLAGTDHGRMFLCFRFVEFLHIHRFCFPVDSLYFNISLEVGLLHLQRDESSRQGYDADVMSRSSFYGNDVSLFQFDLVAVAVIAFSGVFKLHFHHITLFRVAWYVCQPIVSVQFLILSGASFAAKTAAPIMKLIFHSLYIYYCFNSTIIFREKSKNTILAFTFCSICSCASLSSSMMPITFLSLTKGAKREAKFCSLIVMYVRSR